MSPCHQRHSCSTALLLGSFMQHWLLARQSSTAPSAVWASRRQVALHGSGLGCDWNRRSWGRSPRDPSARMARTAQKGKCFQAGGVAATCARLTRRSRATCSRETRRTRAACVSRRGPTRTSSGASPRRALPSACHGEGLCRRISWSSESLCGGRQQALRANELGGRPWEVSTNGRAECRPGLHRSLTSDSDLTSLAF